MNSELTQKQKSLKTSLILKAFNAFVTDIEDKVAKKIPFDTAYHGNNYHAIFEDEFANGRYIRKSFDTFCSPKKNLISQDSKLNESHVTCSKCIVKMVDFII